MVASVFAHTTWIDLNENETSEEADGRGDLRRIGDAPHRDLQEEVIGDGPVVEALLHERRQRGAGSDGVDADVAGGDFERHRAGQPGDAVFAGRVGGGVGV